MKMNTRLYAIKNCLEIIYGIFLAAIFIIELKNVPRETFSLPFIRNSNQTAL